LWDVVVVGAGPAGTATAITLATNGWRVLLLEKQVSVTFKLGESLPPASIGLVKHFLGDLDGMDFNHTGLSKTAGNASVWTSDQIDIADFFFTTAGYGLCIDRLAFDENLRVKAADAGVTVLKGLAFKECESVDDPVLNWQLTLVSNSQKQQHHARYLVDCSGRQAVVAKHLGVDRTCEDQLFAYSQWFSLTGASDKDHFTRIEASPQGWWYSNRLPGLDDGEVKRLVVFHTDRDLPAARHASSVAGFDELLQGSNHIAPLLEEKGYRACGAIRGAPAGSQKLKRFTGDAWMAVGDAAQAYDPLSSQGIYKALDTGCQAAQMIHYALTECSGDVAGLSTDNRYIRQYENQQNQLWENYVAQRDFYYGSQPRWSDQLFWSRRRFSGRPLKH